MFNRPITHGIYDTPGGRGYFSTTSGNVTDDIIIRYLDQHMNKNGFSPAA